MTEMCKPMEVKNAIKWLQEIIDKHGEDTELIIAWWDAEAFGMEQDSEEWLSMVEIIGCHMDWSRTHEDMELTYEARKVD